MYSYLILGLLPLLAVAAPSASDALVNKRSITCLAVGSTATATWTNSAGKTCRFTGVVGSNYGTNAAGGECVSSSCFSSSSSTSPSSFGNGASVAQMD